MKVASYRLLLINAVMVEICLCQYSALLPGSGNYRCCDWPLVKAMNTVFFMWVSVCSQLRLDQIISALVVAAVVKKNRRNIRLIFKSVKMLPEYRYIASRGVQTHCSPDAPRVRLTPPWTACRIGFGRFPARPQCPVPQRPDKTRC